MKKISMVAAAVLMVAMLSSSAFAANSMQQGTFGLSVGFTDLSAFPGGMEDTIIAKYFLANDLAAVLGFGFTNASGDPGMPDGTDLSLVIGVRKYLKKDDFAPFVEGMLVYFDNETDGPPETEGIGVIANVGAEYFLHKQFSLEGSAGVGLLKLEESAVVGPSADSTVLGTMSLGVRANLYF